MGAIYRQLEIPDEKKGVSITEADAEYIYSFIKEKKISKTLEVGFGYGCSAAHIISATKSLHYVMDPMQDMFSNQGLKNIDKLGFTKYLKFENDFSHVVLPELLKKNLKVDFAFIDGSHKFDDLFVDFYYIDLLLNHNGYILFHDSWMRSTQYLISWIKTNKRNYRILRTPINNLILVKKISSDNRDWCHFKGFGTLKSFLLHMRLSSRYKKRHSKF